MVKRKRSSSGTFQATFHPPWFAAVFLLLFFSSMAAAYQLEVHLHLNLALSWAFTLFPVLLFAGVVGGLPRPARIAVSASGVRVDGKLRLRPPLVVRRTSLVGKLSLQIAGRGGVVNLREVAEDREASVREAVARWRWKSAVFHSTRVSRRAQWTMTLLLAVAIFAISSVFGRSRLITPGVIALVAVSSVLWGWWNMLTLRVGEDGVELSRRGARRYFPIDTLASCSVIVDGGTAEGLELVRRDGRREKVRFPSFGGDAGAKREEPARAASEAVQKAIARFDTAQSG